MADYEKPVPRQADPALTQPFWDATKRHELIIPRCLKCSRHFWYPRQACPHCLSPEWEWTPSSGKGRLHSFTIVRQPQNPAFNDDVPYAYAVVQLEEGVRIVSNLVDVEAPDGVAIDMALEVTFDDVTEEWTLPKFRPA